MTVSAQVDCCLDISDLTVHACNVIAIFCCSNTVTHGSGDYEVFA